VASFSPITARRYQSTVVSTTTTAATTRLQCRYSIYHRKDALAWDQCTDQDLNYVRYRNDYRLAETSRTVAVDGRYGDEERQGIDDGRLTASMTQRPQSSSDDQETKKISLKKFVEE